MDGEDVIFRVAISAEEWPVAALVGERYASSEACFVDCFPFHLGPTDDEAERRDVGLPMGFVG